MTEQPCDPVVVDFFLPRGLLEAVINSWPAPDWSGWMEDDPRQPGKRVSDLATPLPDPVGDVLRGISLTNPASGLGLVDVVYDLGCWAAGLSEMAPGSFLGAHQDAQAHGRLGLLRVVSCVVYVHDGWHSTWGGELCLGEDSALRLACWPGRLVCLATRGVWHSVGTVTGPYPRRAIVLHGYGPPAGQQARRRALFR